MECGGIVFVIELKDGKDVCFWFFNVLEIFMIFNNFVDSKFIVIYFVIMIY